MYADFLASALVTLLVTVDPPGLAPIFLSVTRGMTADERRRVAARAALIAFGILAFFGLGGEVLLRLLGVGLPAFRIAGGLLLFWIAFEMVFERSSDRKLHTAEVAITQDHIRNVAAFPLAMPLMAGPGAITAMILLAGRAEASPLALALLLALVAAVMFACLAVFAAAEPLARLLGVTGQAVLTRLLGVILAALAVQFVIDGARAVAVFLKFVLARRQLAQNESSASSAAKTRTRFPATSVSRRIDVGVKRMRARQDRLRSMVSSPPQSVSTFCLARAGASAAGAT